MSPSFKRRQAATAAMVSPHPAHTSPAKLRNGVAPAKAARSEWLKLGNRWFDVRVRIYPAGAEEPHQTSPQFEPLKPAPGMAQKRPNWFAFFAGKGEWK